MAINEIQIKEFLNRKVGPGRDGRNPGDHSGPPMLYDGMDIKDLQDALEAYSNNNSMGNFNKIKAIFEKKDVSKGDLAYDIIKEFGMQQPQTKNTGSRDSQNKDFWELEQIGNAKSTLSTVHVKENGIDRTFRQMGEVSMRIVDLYEMSMTGGVGHDLAFGALAVTGIVVSSGVVLAGNIVYSGLKKLGNKIFKAPKVSPETTKGKKYKVSEKTKNDKNKSIRAMKQARAGKKLSKELLEFANNDVEQSTISDETFLKLDENMAKRLKEVRGDKGEFVIDKFQEDLTKQSAEEIQDLRLKLNTIKNRALLEALNKYNMNLPEGASRLTEEQMQEIMYLSRVETNEDGKKQLVLPPTVGVTIDDLKGIAGLEELLMQNIEMPRISSLTDAQVVEVANRIQVKDGKISYKAPEENEKLDETVQQMLEGLSGEEHYVSGLEHIESGISQTLNQHELTTKVLKEVQARNRQIVCQDLDKQMDVILGEVTRINSQEEVSKDDETRRAALRKLAEKKVHALEKAGIVETLEKGGRRETHIISDGEKILTPDLEKAEKIGRKPIQEITEEQELGG